MFRIALPLAVAASLLAAGCTRAAEDTAFGDRVRGYLIAHPEVLEEVIAKLQEKKTLQANAKAVSAIREHRQAIEQDPRDFVANPKGAITVTEFYDYRCAHCINAAPHVIAIIRANPDVRFVFKELPIFGAPSERAARAAIGVKRAGGDYVALYQAFMNTKPLDEAAVARILKERGYDPKAAESGQLKAEADRQLADIQQLAVEVGIEGTPAFIIGDTLVPGEDMDAVNAAIKAERAKAGKK